MNDSKFNKICIVCGKQYRYCSTCREFADQPTWRNSYDELNCRTIFQTMTDYNMGIMDAEDAIKIIKNCDISVITNVKLKEHVDQLLALEDSIKATTASTDTIEDTTKDEWHVAESVAKEESITDADKNADNRQEVKDENYVKNTNDLKFFEKSKKNPYKGKKH